MRRASSPRTPPWIALLLVCTSLVAGLALCEAFVRVFFPEPILPRFVRDGGYGVRDNMPDIRTRHSSPGDYSVAVSTNAHGMRNHRRDYRPGRNTSAYRIALLGDSFVFGFGVEDDEVVSAQLEDRLNAGGKCRYEVLNFGVAGFGQAEELIHYRHKVRILFPDAVVLFYFNNDLGNNEVSGLFEVDATNRARPTGRVYLPGVALRKRLYAMPPARWLFEHSELWNLFRNRFALVIQRQLIHARGMGSFDTSTEHSVLLTRALVTELVADLRRDGALCVVLVVPTREMRTNFPFSSQEVRALGAQFLDASDLLTTADYFARDTHWRPAGHRTMAGALASIFSPCPRASAGVESERPLTARRAQTGPAHGP
jgi:hypothetical protein